MGHVRGHTPLIHSSKDPNRLMPDSYDKITSEKVQTGIRNAVIDIMSGKNPYSRIMQTHKETDRK
jgi:hypothetical protein